MSSRLISKRLMAGALLASLALPAPAFVERQESSPLGGLVRSDERLRPAVDVGLLEHEQALLAPEVLEAWDAFRNADPDLGASWVGYVDRRTGFLESAEGAGIPWLPGSGNSLTAADVAKFLDQQGLEQQGLAEAEPSPLTVLEARARALLADTGPLLGVDPKDLALSEERSMEVGGYLWYLEFDLVRGGRVVEGARVVFRVGHGNLIQFGTENVPTPDSQAPKAKIDAKKALSLVKTYVGGLDGEDEILDAGSLHLLPARRPDDRFAEGYAFGDGRGLLAVWEVSFHKAGRFETWRARVDAVTGEILAFEDTNHYSRMLGGVYQDSPAVGPEVLLPMPFANLSTGGSTDSAGNFPAAGAATTSLVGPYVGIQDGCGPINAGTDANGDINLGLSPGTDCATPGFGGAGNTHASRTQFYHVNRAKEAARGWLPNLQWPTTRTTVQVNEPSECNAYFVENTRFPSLSFLRFFQSGIVPGTTIPCGNSGEFAGISVHEYAHGLDRFDGNGNSLDRATGETYGDFTAALQIRNSCMGHGFLSINCGGYGDPCTQCTGVRDLDWARRSSGTPHTVANFIEPMCPVRPGYVGPCGREGHCESYVGSEALWDLVARDLPGAGGPAAWAVAERLWYLSRPTATHIFRCDTTTTPWSSDGCSMGSYWRALRAVDDDDGDLSNGTPHSAALFAAFDRHGIACATDPGAGTSHQGCPPPTVPTVTLARATNQVTVNWNSSGAGVVYDVFRNEAGCNAGFTKVANDVTGLTYVDGDVIDGGTYFYQVVAHPAGNEACAAPPSTCTQITLPTALDVWSQDKPWDTGLEPDPATDNDHMHESEDIWVRSDATPGPHQNPVPGQQNYLWARARNRSAVDGYGIPVKIYVANASTGLSWPGQWTHIGTALVDVPAGGTAEVSVPWTPAGLGHYCVLARLDTPQDPMRRPEESNIWRNVRYNNNIVWRNLNILSTFQGSLKADFILRNLAGQGLRHNLVFREAKANVEGHFLDRGRVTVTLPALLAERWQSEGQPGEGIEPLDGDSFLVLDPERTAIPLYLKEGDEFDITLKVEDTAGKGADAEEAVYTLEVLQEQEDEEIPVGGVTYRILAPKL